MQAESVARAAGREAVAEQAPHILGRDSDAVVDDRDAHAARRRFAMRSVISLSVRPDSSHAYLALRTRLTRICSTLCLSTVIGGTSPNSRCSVTPWRSKAPAFKRRLSSTRAATSTVSVTPQQLGIALLHRHGVLDVLEIVAQQSKLLERRALIRRELLAERRQIFGYALAAGVLGDELADGSPCSGAAPRGAIRPRALDCLTRSATRFADMLTLFRMLPTLCRTLVATSAMPASRDAVISSLCTRSSSISWRLAFRGVLDHGDGAERLAVRAGQPAGARQRRARRASLRHDDEFEIADGLAAQSASQREIARSATGVTPSMRQTSAVRV